MCTPAHGGRAGNMGDRAPVLVRRDRPPRPEPPRQGRGPGDDCDGWPPPLHRSARAPRHACLPPARSHRAAAALVATAHDVDHLRRRDLRVSPGAVAPAPADVRQAHEPVDARAGGRGPVRPGPHAAPGQRRHDASGPAPVGRGLAAGQAWEHQSRSGVCPTKPRRDQLIQRALAQPTWALGCGDDGWWRRLAQPAPHRGTDAEAQPTWPERTPPPDDPEPKALAGDGLLGRPGPQQADRLWLRCVAGRPVSAGTIDVLAWCSAPLAAQGLTALVLLWDNAAWPRRQAVRDPPAPPAGQARRRRGASRDLPLAQQKPLAASPGAERGAWQAGRVGSGPAAACGRTRSTGVCLLGWST